MSTLSTISKPVIRDAPASDASQLAPRSAVAARVLRMALGLALLMAALSLVDRRQLLSRAQLLDARYLGLGVLLAVPQLCLCALRWQFVAQRLGVPLRYRDALSEYGLSVFVNLVLPFGILGDALRVARHDRRLRSESVPADRTPLSAALHTVIVERASGQIVVGLWSIAALSMWLEGAARGWALGSIVLVGVAAFAFFSSRSASESTTARSEALPRAWSRMLDELQTLLRDLARAFGTPRAALIQLALSTGIVLTLIAQLYCALGSLSLGLAARDALQIFPFMLLSMALPFSFAGFGPRELATRELYYAAHLSNADGVAFALAYGVLTLLAAVPCLIFVAAGRRA